MQIKLGLSFDDVLLVPQRSEIASRSLVDIATNLTKKIQINTPVVSANMDTVTEGEMAIEMAMFGGVGIIHRFLTISEQAAEVAKVKRHEGFAIDEPRTLRPKDTLADVYKLIDLYGSTGFVVVDDENKVLGLLSKRDFVFEEDLTKLVGDLMTPKRKLVFAKPNTTVEQARDVFSKYKVEKLPVVDEKGKLVGLITSRAVLNDKKYPHSSRDHRGRLLVGAAIGIKEEDKERIKELVAAGVDLVVVDVAHGHASSVLEMTRFIKKHFSVQVVSGNVATVEGVRDLARAGADGIKVGIGPGAVCTTRLVAGSGYPQLSAIVECSREARKFKVPIIADGGIRMGGDVAKAIGAGADSVMVGTLLAGTEEAPGMLVNRNGKKFKVTRGMASLGANMSRKIKNGVDLKVVEDLREYVAEGVEAMVPFRGRAEEILNQLVGGLRSGMSYTGAKNISEMHKRAKFVQVTVAGIIEGKPHDVEVL